MHSVLFLSLRRWPMHARSSHQLAPLSQLEGWLTLTLICCLLGYFASFAVYMTWPGSYCPSSGFLSDLFFPLLWLLSPIIPCC